MDDSASLDSFLGKWRTRWPEWELLTIFVPAPQRGVVAAWFTLLQELGDAAWAGAEPAPGLAKLAWWQEELVGWSRGARRHPLGVTLQRLEAPWEPLGRALAALPATRAPESAGDDNRALELFVGAMLACEAALFDGSAVQGPALAAGVGDLRAMRALVQGGPLPEAGMGAAPVGLTRPRRLHQVALDERLRRQASGEAMVRPATLRLLLAGWRAARCG
ncbi:MULTISPECIES: phytoene/squalene synthase family protein [unclassified Luteimonas]